MSGWLIVKPCTALIFQLPRSSVQLTLQLCGPSVMFGSVVVKNDPLNWAAIDLLKDPSMKREHEMYVALKSAAVQLN